jgi:nucleoside-diphosphate-sugar epimerase
MAGRGRSGLGLSPSAPRRGWAARDPAASRVYHARAGPDGCAPARRRRCRRDAAHRLRRGYELLRRDGPRPITEDTPPQPSAWGRCLAPALERVDGYIVAGQPIVAAFPGWVYGNGGWFRERVIEPVLSGRRVLLFGKTGPWMSPIHVEDCARALVHLAERGDPGGRYFLVNRDPIRLLEFAETFARLANRPLRVLRVPAVATRFVVGPVLADHLLANAVFSNIRLRGIGFRFLYPTLDEGLRQVLGALDE